MAPSPVGRCLSTAYSITPQGGTATPARPYAAASWRAAESAITQALVSKADRRLPLLTRGSLLLPFALS